MLRLIWRMAGVTARRAYRAGRFVYSLVLGTAIVAVTAAGAFVEYILAASRALVESIILTPRLYGEYKRVKPRGLKNRLRVVARIVKRVYGHKFSPVNNALRVKLIGLHQHTFGRPRHKNTLPHQPAFLDRALRAAAVVGIVAVAVANILLPALQVRASSLTWSSNADFAMNKTGKCGATTSSNIVVSGTGYTDVTCATAGADASMALKNGGIMLSDVKSVANGYAFSLALKNDGTVWAWGDNTDGQLGINSTTKQSLPIQVKDSLGTGYLTGVQSISAGYYYSVAIKNDGTVWAWGNNVFGQLGDGTSTKRTLPVQVKDSSGAGYLAGFIAISSAASHSLAIKNDGTVWAWGNNESGQIGIGASPVYVYLPRQVKDSAGTGNFVGGVAVAAGGDATTSGHSLVLKSDGTVWAFGLNNRGQLADGTLVTRNLPVQVRDSAGTGYLLDVASVAAGANSVFAVTSNGSAYGWGLNGNGQLGDGTVSDRSLPVQVRDVAGGGALSGIRNISAGSARTLAVLQDGTVWAWGKNNYGQLGNGTTTQSLLPVQVKDSAGTGFLGGISALSGASDHSLAVATDGSVYGWGYNSSGQAGYGEQVQPQSRLLPVKILTQFTQAALSGVKSVAAATYHSLALKPDGTVWAWGLNGNGQLGDGSTTQRSFPVQVKDSTGAGYLENIQQVSAGGGRDGSYSLALDADGTVWAWGYGSYGQLGGGGIVSPTLPVRVKDSSGLGYLNDVKKVVAGYYHSVAIKNDGTLWTWGWNNFGQLGDGTVTQRNLPVQVKDPSGTGYLSGVTDVATGGAWGAGHTLAVKSDGTAWSWGYNGNGQLGDGTTAQRILPVQVKDPTGAAFMTNVVMVAGTVTTDPNGSASFALKSDGTVWSWGWGVGGVLGDGTSSTRLLPVQVKDSAGTGYLTNIKSISGGWSSAYALDNDGYLWAWGNNSYGQLGNNTFNSSNLPVKIKDFSGSSYLDSGISVAAGNGHAIIARSDGSVVSIGYNNYTVLGDNSTINRPLPVQTLSSVIFSGGHLPLGSSSGHIVDLGPTRKTKWQSIDWNTDALPANTSVTFSARTSNNGTDWSAWSAGQSQTTAGSTTGTASLASLPFSRFIELKATLANTDFYGTPTLHDFSLTMMDDQVTPPTNAANVVMKKSPTGSTVAAGAWNNATTPYFTWDNGADNVGGSGIAGYCLYLGQDNTADVTTTKGVLGQSPLDTDGKCQYAVPNNALDLAAVGALPAPLGSSNSPYYLLIKALDNAGNLFDGAATQFSFKHDVTPPNNLAFVSLPSQFIPTKDVTITWPTDGAQAASDTNSGLAGVQYRIGANGTWFGAGHSGAQDLTDVLSNSGSYQTDPTHDYPLLSDGNNLIYFRTLDTAGNVSATLTSAVIKINSAAPSTPQSLNATPTTNTTNSFAFSWQQPSTFVGVAANLTYCYTVNTLPTVSTCTYTPPGQTSVTAAPFATQPGDNTFYVVAKDEAGNINYATAASVTFTANTPAPGIPLSLDIADVSVKATQSWKLALAWEPPVDAGAGVANYRVYRSTNALTGYAQVAATSGNSFVDTKLNAVMYYYKIRACDSANNCGAETAVASMTPTGRYTSPAEIIGTPTVEVSTRKVTIRWTTERDSDSKVQYGMESGKYQADETANSAQTKVHQVTLTGLEAGATYYYKAKWTDEDGNTGKTGELMFTTLPAPVIKEVNVIKKSLTSATIQFTTKDTTSVRFGFGKTDALGGLKIINTSLSESTYSVELDGLDDGAVYYFRPDGTDGDGYVYQGNIVSFATPPRPKISNLRFQPVAGEPTSTQKVTWQTNIPATTQVTYGINGVNGTDALDTKPVTEHTMIVRNLKDNSSYFLLAQSRDADGNLAVSDRQIFHTALDTRPPVITDVNIETSIKGTSADARGQIVVTWKTDEPTTSQVAYGQGGGVNGSYPSSTIDDTRLMTEHVVVISDLRTSSVYYLQPLSRDASGNSAQPNEQSAVIGRPTDNVLTIVLNALYKTFGL